jgi:hypothetical protein
VFYRLTEICAFYLKDGEIDIIDEDDELFLKLKKINDEKEPQKIVVAIKITICGELFLMEKNAPHRLYNMETKEYTGYRWDKELKQKIELPDEDDEE